MADIGMVRGCLYVGLGITREYDCSYGASWSLGSVGTDLRFGILPSRLTRGPDRTHVGTSRDMARHRKSHSGSGRSPGSLRGGPQSGRTIHRWLVVLLAVLLLGVVGTILALHVGSPDPRKQSLAKQTPPKPAITGSAAGGTTTSTASARSSWAAEAGSLQPSDPPQALADPVLDNVISQQLGPGWVAGDSCYSTKLPDGQDAFVFADTFIGTVTPDHVPTFTGLIHSSELVGNFPSLESDYGGTFSAPQALIPDTFDPAGIWEPLSTLVFDGSQMIFVNEYKGPPGILSLRYTGRAGIAEMTNSPGGSPQLHSVVLLPQDPITTWGSATFESGGYQYIFGAVINGPQHSTTGMRMARVPLHQFLDIGSWTYWNGSQWVPGESNAVTVATKNDLTGVMANPNGNGFIAVSIPWGVFADTTVDLSYATSPQGPWTTPQPVYTIPEIHEYAGEGAYFPTFHPELAANPDQLVVSYNIDTDKGYAVINEDIRSYQPRFLTITG